MTRLSVDLLDPSFYDDPWASYRRLRDEAPVYFDAKNGLYAVSRYADVVHVARHAERYASGQGNRPVVLAPMSLLSLDDPEHGRQRRLVSRGFTAARVRDMAEWIREIAREVVDGIAARGDIDFVQDFAVHVPLIVIAELLGFDVESRARLARWSDDMTAAEGRSFEDPRVEKAAEAFHAYVDHCSALIEARRIDPRDDIISVLTAKFDAGDLGRRQHADHHVDDALVDDELLMFLVILLVGGNETTRNAIAGGLLAFSRFPDERDKLRRDPSLIDRAVEEILRYTSSAMAHSRTVTEDHELHGVSLRQGDKVLLLWQSANRDERVFPDPEVFRVDRDPNPHVAFGVARHFCLGASLARLELRIAFEELFRRLDDIRVPDGASPTRDAQTMMLAYEHLRAVFTPA
jgi:cytochrome P450 family 142 subfamily A polypeptide 1